MKIIFKFTIFIVIFTSCKAQKPRIEINIQKCASEYYPQKEKSTFNVIIAIEKELISKKKIKSNSGKEYIILLNKIKNENIKIDFSIFNKLDSLYIFEAKHISEINKCRKNLINSNKYNDKIYKELQDKFSVLAKNNSLNSIVLSKTLLEKVREKDFNLMFYKIMTLKNLQLYSMEHLKGMDLKIPKKEVYQNTSENPLYLTLDNNGKINHEKKVIEIGKLKNLISKYIANKKENSEIKVKLSSETKIVFFTKTYEKINEIINELRNEYSKKNYNSEFEKLIETEKKEVEKIIPIKVKMELK